LQVVAASGAVLSPEMKAFNRALARIDKLKTQLTELDALGQQYRGRLAQVLDPLRAQVRAQQREMVLFLDQRLTPAPTGPSHKALSKTQQETARTILCALSAGLAGDGHTDMEAIHDRHSTTSLHDLAQADRRHAKVMLDDLMSEMRREWGGVASEPLADDGDASPEAMLAQAMQALERLQQEHEAHRAERAAERAAKRQAKAQTQPASPQAQALTQQAQAEQTLKNLFRQIASRLHPDREPDEAQRQRKTALMSEANAAYQRQDWVALMQIQLQAELVDPDHASRLSAQRLSELTLLLKQQAAALDRERQVKQAQWVQLLELPWGMPLNATTLHTVLEQMRVELEEEVAGQAVDLADIQTEAGLKTFLNEQRRRLRAEEKSEKMKAEFGFLFQ
jgi:flagellar biosynthesis GTPase FlhF